MLPKRAGSFATTTNCSAAIQEQVAQAEPEYRRRVQEDGQESADKWLAETARELGRRAGEETRRLTDQLHVVTG